MSTRKSKTQKQWEYPITKIRPGGIVTGAYRQKYGSLCYNWPTGQTNASFESHDGNYERFEYYIQSKPYRDRPCEHIKNSVVSEVTAEYGFSSVAPNHCSDGQYRHYQQVGWPEGKFYSLALPPSPRLPDIPDLSQSHREALTFFASGCQPIVANFAVNLFEFKELISLVKNMADAAMLFKKLASEHMPYSWGMFLRKLGRLDPTQRVLFITQLCSKEAANAFLAFNFAVAPLLSDIKSLTDYLSDLSVRVAFFRKNNQTPVKVRFASDLSNAFPTQSVSYPPVSTSDWQTGTVVARTYYRAFYTATARATYDVSGLKDSDISYLLAKKALGFSDPLVFLYEIIPGSFILDWFAKVGDYIASLPSKAIIPYALSNPIHSIRIDQTNVYAIYTYVPSVYTPRIITQQVQHTDVIKYYKRSLGIPLTFKGLDTSLPGLHELMLALSLGRQLFKN